MKRYIKLLCAVIFCMALISEFPAAQCPPMQCNYTRTVKRSSCGTGRAQTRLPNTGTVPMNYGSRRESSAYRDARSLASDEKKILHEIHKMQLDILKQTQAGNSNKIDKLRKRIEKKLAELTTDLDEVANFPFADKIIDFENLLSAIRSGQIDFDDCKGKSKEKILKAIQNQQSKPLNAHHKKMLKRIRVIK